MIKITLIIKNPNKTHRLFVFVTSQTMIHFFWTILAHHKIKLNFQLMFYNNLMIHCGSTKNIDIIHL